MNNLFLLVFIGVYICFNITICIATYSLPVGKCRPGNMVLNDCNWCKCTGLLQYVCHHRNCDYADPFEHFNDAIQGIDVGFEGHGVWRSAEPTCTPGVPYEKGELLCVCTEEGTWPNAHCHAVFQNLNKLEIERNTFKNKCVPGKSYLIGCYVCICNVYSKFDSELCARECKNNETIIGERSKQNFVNYEEVFAECERGKRYKIGCQNCDCIGRNTLVCDKCAKDENKICNTKVKNSIFSMDCNLCYCNKNTLICTVNQCSLKSNTVDLIGNEIEKIVSINEVSSINAGNCVLRTKYESKCGDCFCYLDENGDKVLGCHKNCSEDDTMNYVKNNCVENAHYNKDCQLCSCKTFGNSKWERCVEIKNCVAEKGSDFSNLKGSCEPLRYYKKGCNSCKCLESGKLVSCTDYDCRVKRLDSSVEISTFISDSGDKCPKGTVYKNDCNYCYCLSNGNALCTKMYCNLQF